MQVLSHGSSVTLPSFLQQRNLAHPSGFSDASCPLGARVAPSSASLRSTVSFSQGFAAFGLRKAGALIRRKAWPRQRSRTTPLIVAEGQADPERRRPKKEGKVARLREILASPGIHQGPACHDALSAKLVEKAGFSFAFTSGFAISATRLGLPDAGLISYGEMVDQGRLIANTVKIPVIGDGDNGYGNEMNVKRTVAGYAQAGFAGILIEDQVSPKACGHTRGRKVVSREEAVMRIRAAVDARDEGDDIVIVARTDARQAVSLEEALWRVAAFAEAGADVLFIDALAKVDEMKAFCEVVPGVPKMANMLEGGGRTPVLPPLELAELGFKIVAYPLSLLGVSIRAMEDALRALSSGRLPPPSQLPTFEEIRQVVGFPEYYAEETRYALPTSTNPQNPITPSSSPSPSSSSSSPPFSTSSSSSSSSPSPSSSYSSSSTSSSSSFSSSSSSSTSSPPPPPPAQPSPPMPAGETRAGAAGAEPEARAAEPGVKEPGPGSAKAWGREDASEAPKSAEGEGLGEPRGGSEWDKAAPEAQKAKAEEVVEPEVLEPDFIREEGQEGGPGPRQGPYERRDSSASKAASVFSSVLRIKVTAPDGTISFDASVPANFLNGLAAMVPAVAGVDLRSLLNQVQQQGETKTGQTILDIKEKNGDRIQIIIE